MLTTEVRDMPDETDDQRLAREAKEAAAASEESGHTEAANVYEAIATWVENT